jgi:hypothetical protein
MKDNYDHHLMWNISNNVNVFSPDSKPYGLTYGDWSVKWWQWALSIPKDHNPLIDTSGQRSTQNQSGPVWFLAGTLGGSAERTCIIPSGKAILFPISNNECSFAEYPNAKTESELRSSAKADIDQVANLNVVIDSVVISGLEKFRFQSPSFFLTLPENNILGLPAITTQSVSDGFWILLHPLSPGKHEVHFGGSCSADIVKVEATYHLTVES